MVSTFALRAAAAMSALPRSLKDPVGLALSSFANNAPPPASAATCGRATSGVEPSPSVISGRSGSDARKRQTPSDVLAPLGQPGPERTRGDAGARGPRAPPRVPRALRRATE